MKADTPLLQATNKVSKNWFQRSERWQMFTASPMVVVAAIWLGLIWS